MNRWKWLFYDFRHQYRVLFPTKAPEPYPGETHIRTHDIGSFYDSISRPTEIGTLVEINTPNGRIGIYELVKIQRATGVDWNWYDLEFRNYKNT